MLKVNRHFCDVAFLTKRLAEEYFAEQLKKNYGETK
jgi:hypothetical protein